MSPRDPDSQRSPRTSQPKHSAAALGADVPGGWAARLSEATAAVVRVVSQRFPHCPPTHPAPTHLTGHPLGRGACLWVGYGAALAGSLEQAGHHPSLPSPLSPFTALTLLCVVRLAWCAGLVWGSSTHPLRTNLRGPTTSTMAVTFGCALFSMLCLPVGTLCLNSNSRVSPVGPPCTRTPTHPVHRLLSAPLGRQILCFLWTPSCPCGLMAPWRISSQRRWVA
jgi:hypothetical protein